MAKRARTCQEKDLDGQEKATSTPLHQIQDVEPRKGRLGLKTIPCIIGGDARIKEL